MQGHDGAVNIIVRTQAVPNEAEQAAIRHIAVIAALHPQDTNYLERYRQHPSFIITRALDLAGYPMRPWHEIVYAWMYDKPYGEL